MSINLDEIKIRNAWSEAGEADLMLIYSQDGKRKTGKIPKWPWYCLIKKEDYLSHKFYLNKSGLVDNYEEVGDYVKLYSSKQDGKSSSRANILRTELAGKGIKTFEDDFHTAKRFLIDTNAKVDDQYDILYFDIETDDSVGKIEVGKYPILSFAGIDNKGNEIFLKNEDIHYEYAERELVDNILRTLAKYDIIAGWNSGEFDLPYIIQRKEQLSKQYRNKWWKVAHIDMLARARKLFKEDAAIESFSLNSVSKHFLGEEKVKFKGRVIDLYTNDPEKLREYNLTDAKLLKKLDEKIGMIDLIAKECALSGTLVRDFQGLYVSTVLDTMIVKKAHEKGIWCPSKKQAVQEDLVGGLVLDPEPGYYKNVYVFDFKSLYPSIIMTCNIGFDSLAKEGEEYIINPGTGVHFAKHRKSVIAEVVENLVNERQVYKKLRLDLVGQGKMNSIEYENARANEIIVKELSNSVYGIMGNKGLRYYSKETAESITKSGHYLLQFTRDYFNSLDGCHVIYGDTDSIFVQSKNVLDVEDALKLYHTKLAESLKQFNIDKTYIQLKYEKLFEGIILIGKKYYAGYVTNIEGKEVREFIPKGLDLVKKRTPPVSLRAQRGLVDLILGGGSVEEVKKYIQEQKEIIEVGEFKFEEIRIHTQVKNNQSGYSEKSKNQPHIKLARKIIEEKGMLETREIEYVVVDEKLPSESLEKQVLEQDYKGVFDRKYYWNDVLFKPMTKILNPSFPEIDWEDLYKIKSPRRKKEAEGQQALF